MQQELSKLWTVNVQDFVQGCLAAVGMAVAMCIYQMAAACATFACALSAFSWTKVEDVAFVAFVTFIGTKFSLDQNGKLFGKI